jgi:hypothetical protein
MSFTNFEFSRQNPAYRNRKPERRRIANLADAASPCKTKSHASELAWDSVSKRYFFVAKEVE